MTTITLDQLRNMSAVALAGFGAQVLCQLKDEATARMQSEKATVELIDQALDRKYADKTRELRLAEGKDTGVVHFQDGAIRITADLPKKAEWDQQMLADMARRIAAANEDPGQYIDVAYRVSETKFAAWPDNLRSQFSPARTLKTGKATYRLTPIKE